MIKKNVLYLLLIFISVHGQNQKDTHLNFLPKSPDVSAIGKYLDKPISLSNGSINVSIPLYTLSINSNLSIPLNLQYNTQGIKVSEVASSVGQGWNLSSIGLVSRNIRGKKDNYNDSSFYLQSIADAKTNLMNNSTSPNVNAWLDQNSDNVDLEPDEFNVSLFNMNFKFVYDFSTNKFYSTPLNNIKIIPTLNNTGSIISFKIIDDEGNIYFFGSSDDNDNRFEVIDEISSTLISNDNAFSSGTDPQFNTWLLIKMITNDNKVVRFYYDDNFVTASDLSTQDVYLNAQYKYFANTPDFVNGKYDVISWAGGQPHVVSTKYPISSEIAKTKDGKVYNVYSVPVIHDKIINRIIFENTEIEFVKSTVKRKDFNAFSLDKIRIKNNNRLIKSFQLEQSYFNDEYLNPLSDNSRTKNYIFTNYFDKSCFRLKLNGISEYDYNNQSVAKYRFEYFPGQLPSKLSFAQDFFGYFNGELNNTELIPNINFNYGYGLKSAGIAQRHVSLDHSKIGMLRAIVYPTGGSTEFEYENHTYQAINDINDSVVGDLFSLQTYTVDFASEQSADPSTGNINPPESSYEQTVVLEEGVNGTLNTFINKVVDVSGHTVDSYNVIIYRKVNGNWEIFTLMSYSIQKTLWFPEGEYLFTASRKIAIDDPAVIEAGFALTLSFLKSMPNPSGNPSNPTSIQTAGGLRIKSVTQKENSLEVLRTEYLYNEISNGNILSTGILYGYPLLVSQNFYEGINKFYGVIDYPFRSGSGSNIIYGKVTEVISNNQNNKKIKKEYFFSNNASSEIDEATIEFRNRTPYFGWKLNNLKEVLYYNQNENNEFKLIQKDEITYDQNNTKLNYTFGIRLEPRDKVLYSTLDGTDPSSYIFKTLYKYEYYPLFTDYSFKRKSKTTKFMNTQEITETTDYEYNNPLHYQLSKQKVTFPDGTSNETNYSYAHEKGNQLMIDRNMIGIPLETVSTQTVGNTTKTLSRSETIYPTSVPASQSGNLLLPLSVKSYDVLNNTASYTEATYDKYDSKGNLQQYTTKDGISTVIIWGYDHTQPIAKIEGAQLSGISQSLIDTIVNASNTDAQNGTETSEQNLISALDTFRSDASLSGYQISTYTYDPLIGVRSITPPSGIREYYRYDTANRLEKVIDSDKKVLKEFKYNYKN